MKDKATIMAIGGILSAFISTFAPFIIKASYALSLAGFIMLIANLIVIFLHYKEKHNAL